MTPPAWCEAVLGESCYVVVNTSLDHAAARNNCREAYGGHLVVIDDAQENEFVGQLALSKRARQSYDDSLYVCLIRSRTMQP